jgi:LemA protein
MDTRKVVQRLYPETVARRRWWDRLRRTRIAETVREIRAAPRRMGRWIQANPYKIAFLLIGALVWAGLHITYYNRLLFLQQDAEAAWAQVISEQQRRFHIGQSLTRLLIGYARHERQLMIDLTALRAKAKGGDPASAAQSNQAPAAGAAAGSIADLTHLSPDELKSILPDLMVTAEQYPALRLSENIQQLSAGIVATETRIADKVQAYNSSCNIYMTALRQFPGVLFAKAWRFEACEFYVPPEPRATAWAPPDLGPQLTEPSMPAARSTAPPGGAARP